LIIDFGKATLLSDPEIRDNFIDVAREESEEVESKEEILHFMNENYDKLLGRTITTDEDKISFMKGIMNFIKHLDFEVNDVINQPQMNWYDEDFPPDETGNYLINAYNYLKQSITKPGRILHSTVRQMKHRRELVDFSNIENFKINCGDSRGKRISKIIKPKNAKNTKNPKNTKNKKNPKHKGNKYSKKRNRKL
jgi:hypothetical protein